MRLKQQTILRSVLLSIFPRNNFLTKRRPLWYNYIYHLIGKIYIEIKPKTLACKYVCIACPSILLILSEKRWKINIFYFPSIKPLV